MQQLRTEPTKKGGNLKKPADTASRLMTMGSKPTAAMALPLSLLGAMSTMRADAPSNMKAFWTVRESWKRSVCGDFWQEMKERFSIGAERMARRTMP